MSRNTKPISDQEDHAPTRSAREPEDRITDAEVMATHLGLADENISAKMAAARLRGDKDLARIEAKYGIEPEETEEEEFSNYSDVPPSVSRYFNKEWDDLEWFKTVLAELAKMIEDSPDGRRLDTKLPLLKDRKTGSLGLAPSHNISYTPSLLDGASETLPADIPAEPFVFATTRTIHVRQGKDDVPYGVVRVIAALDGVPLASVVRIMEFVEAYPEWHLEISKTALFGRAVPSGNLEYYALPARLDTLACFPRSDIEELAAEPTPRSEQQRQLVSDLIHDLKEWENV